MKKHNINLVNRYYTAGGLNGIYSKQYNFYKLLKNADYKSLRKYYSKNRDNNVHRTFIIKVIDKLKYYKRLLIDEYLPINKYPHYDHMYNYYRKVK